MSQSIAAFNYRDKYLSKNPISRYLVGNFYSAVEAIVREVSEPARSAIEIGCGEGFSSARLARMLGDGVAFQASELEPDLVVSAKARNPGLTVTQESLYDLKHPNAAFDLVFTLEVLEHLEDPERALREISRVTKRWAVLSVPREPIWSALNMVRGKYWSDFGNTPGHIQSWSTSAFKRLLDRHFAIRAVRTPLPWTIVLCEKRPGT